MSEKVDGSALKHYMGATNRSKLGNRPTYHSNCIAACKVARPGKTAKDKAKREIK